MTDLTDPLEDLRSEFPPRKPKRHRCQDMMCGATDCWTCYPNPHDHQDEKDNEDED